MNKYTFLLPILLLVTIFSQAQNNCGTVPSQDDINNTINLQSSMVCVDIPTGINEAEPITLNLILRYAKDGQAAGELSQNDRNAIETNIESVFDDHYITFNYMWTELNCTMSGQL